MWKYPLDEKKKCLPAFLLGDVLTFGLNFRSRVARDVARLFEIVSENYLPSLTRDYLARFRDEVSGLKMQSHVAEKGRAGMKQIISFAN